MAMFPVGSFYLQNAEIADRGSALARSVMSDVIARGMLDPNAWRMPAIPPAYSTNSDGTPNAFTRSLGSAMAEEMILPSYTSYTPVQRQARIAQRFGGAYILDPIGVAATTTTAPVVNPNLWVGPFPAEASLVPPATYNGVYAWQPWNYWNGAPANNANYFPVRRVTLYQPATTGPPGSFARMESPVAWSLFNGTDDLAFEVPLQGDQPAMQMWDLDSNGAPMSRQWIGDYSWIVSIAPTSNAAQLALASNPQSYAYDVSVVVFYKRGISSKKLIANGEAIEGATSLRDRERMVKAQVVSTGLNGGEMRLKNANVPGATDPFRQLRAGQWVMVCGPHPASGDLEPRFALNWYQVMAIDDDGVGMTPVLDKVNERVVTLRGPEWPWQPQASATDLSNNLCVGIMPGAVAVHTKTLRLEPRRGPAMGSGWSFGTGPSTQGDPTWQLR
jgi:hypothetical protein